MSPHWQLATPHWPPNYTPPMPRQSFQSPKGTRDFYPQDLLIRRYITDAWRRVALRHGFDEIDGPTFETAALYKVKSGDAILGEMFGVFSGKDPEDVAAAGRGDPPFVLRPEFTPTLARMYAAKAAQLPKPTKWFCVPNFFRAERQQRGRLREFMQFNVDFLAGDDPAMADAEVIACAVDLFASFGLRSSDLLVRLSSRAIASEVLRTCGVSPENVEAALQLLDKIGKMSAEAHELACAKIGFTVANYKKQAERLEQQFSSGITGGASLRAGELREYSFQPLIDLRDSLANQNLLDWCKLDMSIARGLAYYTGTVFEVIAEGERAVAGGGRYDNLVELFGGPPTPACGFGMGDVVLGNLLTDKGLMPDGKDLLNAVSRPMPVRPDVFVIAANDEAQAHVTPLVAQLRRGTESRAWLARDNRKPWDADRYQSADREADPAVPPLHARRSYKSTKNVGKLLADASACHARFAVILESPEKATIKNLDSANQQPIDTKDIGAHITRTYA